MNPISSIPPTPPQTHDPSSPKETVPSTQIPAQGTPASSSSSSMDVVSLSTPTQEVSHYLEQMSQIPDVRQGRVTHIQKAIDSNSYVISPENLANKILQELSSQPQEPRAPTAS